MTTRLILVDKENRARGTATREEAHASPGLLHRAFSIYIFRKMTRELLIQKRNDRKLFGGLWANTCCSHPRDGEEILTVAPRRLQEELGFACSLSVVGSFVYQAEDPAGKGSEHEHVTILRGDVEDDLSIHANPDEVAEWKWMSVKELHAEMKNNPDDYAPWFHTGIEIILHTK